jgi:hypothetical protein
VAQALQMFREFEDAALVQAQAFPAAIAALDERIEDADLGFGSWQQLTADVDEQVLIEGVE